MKDRWDQNFFWVLESNVWIQKERTLTLDIDYTNVLISISGTTTSGSTS